VEYDPRAQKPLRVIPIPSRYVTSCAFGGPQLSELFVTTASAGEGWPPDYELEPEAGSLFLVSGLGVRGVKSVPFAGKPTSKAA
jgi:sugar lactone lactonase YvrE